MAFKLLPICALLCIIVMLKYIPSQGLFVPNTVKATVKGTTSDLKDKMQLRCLKFINENRRYSQVSLAKAFKFCIALYKKFTQAFAYKHSCDVKPKDYHHFLTMARFPYVEDKALFAPIEHLLARELSNTTNGYVAVTDTPAGYILDGLVWCGKEGSPKDEENDGINYDECPTECKDGSNPSELFWGLASEMLAEAANGTVRILVNGDTVPPHTAYHRDSILGGYVIRYLSRRVMKVIIWVANEPGKPVYEHCGTDSILKLQKRINKTLELAPVCVEDPPEVLKLYCNYKEFEKAAAEDPKCKPYLGKEKKKRSLSALRHG